MDLSQLVDLSEFTEFPFDLKPTNSPQVWAGMKRVLEGLLEFRDNVEVNHLVEFGILTGDYGTGKSHSLLYLKHLIDSTPRDGGSLTVYIDNPVGIGAKGTFVEDYGYIMSHSIGNEKLQKIFANAEDLVNTIAAEKISKLKPAEMIEINKSSAKTDEMREQVYVEKVGESPLTYFIFKELVAGNPDAWEWLLGESSQIGKEQVQPLTSHILAAKALATVIKLATLRHDGKKHHTAVFVFIDQTEDIGGLKPGIFQEMIAGWRTLIDELESNFGMLWAMDGQSEDVVGNFGDAIDTRVTVNGEMLKLVNLEDEDAKTFLTEVMKYFRKKGSGVPSPIYPFTEDGLDEAVVSTTPKTPRALLTKCRMIFTRAAKANAVKSKKDVLNQDKVRELLAGPEST
jgi:hypothetical protein